MSDRRDTESDDRRLSQAYRELANERPAANLDAKILKAARDAATSRQARLRRWTRPLAWAATIGLSLAIVLQVTEQPVPEVPSEVLSELPTEVPAATAAGSAEARRQDLDITQPYKKEGPVGEATSDRVEEAFTPDMDMLREAEDMGRMKSSRAQLGAEPEAAARKSLADAPQVFCDETARASAASWLECIAELREQHKYAAAESEQAAFDARFGNAETP
jgi:hypothetical protein